MHGLRYVGNTMATFVLQSLGCDVAAMNTVHFSKASISRSRETAPVKILFPASLLPCSSRTVITCSPGNHTGYGQVAGTKSSVKEIQDIYEGLQRSYLTNFDVLLSGYAPSADAVQAVGVIGRDLRTKAAMKPGSFFWGTYRV